MHRVSSHRARIFPFHLAILILILYSQPKPILSYLTLSHPLPPHLPWGQLLEKPGNIFSGPKANLKIKNLLNSMTVPSSKPVNFVLLTDSFTFHFQNFCFLEHLILNATTGNIKQLSGFEKLPGLSRNGPLISCQSCCPCYFFTTSEDTQKTVKAKLKRNTSLLSDTTMFPQLLPSISVHRQGTDLGWSSTAGSATAE